MEKLLFMPKENKDGVPNRVFYVSIDNNKKELFWAATKGEVLRLVRQKYSDSTVEFLDPTDGYLALQSGEAVANF